MEETTILHKNLLRQTWITGFLGIPQISLAIWQWAQNDIEEGGGRKLG